MHASIAGIQQSVVLTGVLFGASLGAQFELSSGDMPAALRPPTGQSLLLKLKGKGNQIYVCQSAEGAHKWKLKGPDAKLFAEDGEWAGRHFAGPTWEAKDGSRVAAKMTATVEAPDPEAIPWLLLTVTSHDGQGVLSRVESILRVNTKGGAVPASGCAVGHDGDQTSIAYEATYAFYGTPRH